MWCCRPGTTTFQVVQLTPDPPPPPRTDLQDSHANWKTIREFVSCGDFCQESGPVLGPVPAVRSCVAGIAGLAAYWNSIFNQSMKKWRDNPRIYSSIFCRLKCTLPQLKKKRFCLHDLIQSWPWKFYFRRLAKWTAQYDNNVTCGKY